MAPFGGDEPCAPRAPGLGWGRGSRPGASPGRGAVGSGSGLTVPQASKAAPGAALGGSMQVLLGDATVSLLCSSSRSPHSQVSPPQAQSWPLRQSAEPELVWESSTCTSVCMDKTPPSPGHAPGNAEIQRTQRGHRGSPVPVTMSQCLAVVGTSQQGPHQRHIRIRHSAWPTARPGMSPRPRSVPPQGWVARWWHAGPGGGCFVQRGFVPRGRRHPWGWGSAEAKAGENAVGDGTKQGDVLHWE